MQDNYDTSQSCSRGVCLRSCWISTSGRGRRPSSSALSSWPCWSCYQRKEPRLPSVSNIPGSTPRHTNSILIGAQGMSWLGSIEQNWGLRQLCEVHITSTALRSIHSPERVISKLGCLICKDCYLYTSDTLHFLFQWQKQSCIIMGNYPITKFWNFRAMGPFIMTWLGDPNGWWESSIDQWM